MQLHLSVMRQRGRETILRDLKVKENLGPERKESPPPWSTQRDKQGRLIPRAADFNLLQSGTRQSPTHNNLSTILLANEGFLVTAEKSCTYISVLNYLHPSFVSASKPPASKMPVNKCQKRAFGMCIRGKICSVFATRPKEIPKVTEVIR